MTSRSPSPAGRHDPRHHDTGPDDPGHVVVLGLGASGILTSRRLLDRGLRVTAIDPRPTMGGLAYAQADDRHILNVVAGQMGWDRHDPTDFLAWLQRGAATDPAGTPAEFGQYRRRQEYRRYLTEVLTQSPGFERFDRVRAAATEITGTPGHWIVSDSAGNHHAAPHVVLALGNPPPRALAPTPSPAVIEEPYRAQALASIHPDADVIVVGAGLTAVDVLVSLHEQGHRRPVRVVSRRGQLPWSHCPHRCPPEPSQRLLEAVAATAPPERIRRIVLADVAHRRRHDGCWQQVVDSLRPHVAGLWAAYGPEAKDRARPWLQSLYEPHRHRVPPEVHARLQAWLAQGWLRTEARTVARAEAIEGAGRTGPGVVVRARDGAEPMRADVVVNATGAGYFVDGYGPVVSALIHTGSARPGWANLGLAVTETGGVIGRHGGVTPGLWALGPMTRGTRWETTAVAEIRHQAEILADALVLDVGVELTPR